MRGGEFAKRGEIEHFEGAEPFVMAVDGAIGSEIKDEFEAVVGEERFFDVGVIDRFIGFDQRAVAIARRDEEEEEIERIDELECGEMGVKGFECAFFFGENDADAILPKPFVENF